MIAKIILTDSRHVVDRIFDYSIPQSLECKIQPGMRVLVPFGVRNATAEGLVIRITEASRLERLKPVKKLLDPSSVCTQELMDLCFWMQEQYLCTFQQAYKLVKPPHMGTKVREWLLLVQEDISYNLPPLQQCLVDELKARDGYGEYAELYECIGKKNLKQAVYALKDRGILVIRERIDDTMSIKTIRKAQLKCTVDEGYAAADELFAHRAPVQANMVLALCEHGDMTIADLVMVSDGNYTSLKALCEKGILSVYREQVQREAYDESKYMASSAYAPTAEQKPVIEYLNHLIDEGIHEKILLRGVTGSGKTEVFLQAINNCIKQGRQAIMLVPEISLTPQMVERFVSRFGPSVAVMHSGLSQGERFDQWHKIKDGRVSVVVGARSAIFAPFNHLGIIILDEEHESSYKSELSPRYHAQDIAERRAAHFGAPLLLASATPSISTYYSALNGNYTLFEMHKRYNENAMPKARLVDMRSELLDLHNTSPISIRLQEEIRLNLERGEKTILFLNRRGYNTFVSCRACGHVMECENCSIALTYHRKADMLTCHYCGYSHPNVSVCPECGSKFIKFFGTGTQRIEDELHNLFPEARILRMDFDTTSGKGGHEMILNRFKNGEADILLGTQMVTKGLDFSDVTLVGVLAADTSLNIDDFRAHERCFSLITQVCGRAGRGNLEGRAVIQTYQPQNVTINFAKEQNYTDFYKNEIRFRQQMTYPPFCDIVYLLVSGESESEVLKEIRNLGGLLKEQEKTDTNILTILGPSSSPIARIKNKFRYRMLVKIKSVPLILPLLHSINDAHNRSKTKNTLVIDINPINMA